MRHKTYLEKKRIHSTSNHEKHKFIDLRKSAITNRIIMKRNVSSYFKVKPLKTKDTEKMVYAEERRKPHMGTHGKN